MASERDVLVLEGSADPHALLAALDEHHVAGKQLHVSTTAAHTTLVISRENVHNQEKVRSAMNRQFGDLIAFTDGLGAVSAIARESTRATRTSGRLGARSGGVEPRGMSTSSFRITLTVPTMTGELGPRAAPCFIAATAQLVPGQGLHWTLLR